MQAQYVLPLVDISKLQSPDLADRIEVLMLWIMPVKKSDFFICKVASLILITPKP